MSCQFRGRGSRVKGRVENESGNRELRSSPHPLTRSLLCSLLAVTCTLLPVTFLPACGRKTQVRPPEMVAPEPITGLTAEVQDKGIKLRWERPQKYVYGGDLDDLGGFVIFRADQNATGEEAQFTRIAEMKVEDQERFRKAKKFSYTDEQITAGTLYRYRVQAFTLDGYYSRPSNTIEVTWKKQ